MQSLQLVKFEHNKSIWINFFAKSNFATFFFLISDHCVTCPGRLLFQSGHSNMSRSIYILAN